MFDPLALDQAIARGVVVLVCDLALRDPIGMIAAKDGLAEAEARRAAIALLVPGVIVQPSGVFATVLAQQNGCAYVRAS
jgi:hypothetical protein